MRINVLYKNRWNWIATQPIRSYYTNCRDAVKCVLVLCEVQSGTYNPRRWYYPTATTHVPLIRTTQREHTKRVYILYAMQHAMLYAIKHEPTSPFVFCATAGRQARHVQCLAIWMDKPYMYTTPNSIYVYTYVLTWPYTEHLCECLCCRCCSQWGPENRTRYTSSHEYIAYVLCIHRMPSLFKFTKPRARYVKGECALFPDLSLGMAMQ